MREVNPLCFYVPERAQSLQKKLSPIFVNWLNEWQSRGQQAASSKLQLTVNQAAEKLHGDILSLECKGKDYLQLQFDSSKLQALYNLLLGSYDINELKIKNNLLVMSLLEKALSELLSAIAEQLDITIESSVQSLTAIGGELKRYQVQYRCDFGPIHIAIPAQYLNAPVKKNLKKVSRRDSAISVEKAKVVVKSKPIKLKVSELGRLKAGQVLVTDTLLSQPFELRAGNKVISQCYIGKNKENKAIVIA